MAGGSGKISGDSPEDVGFHWEEKVGNSGFYLECHGSSCSVLTVSAYPRHLDTGFLPTESKTVHCFFRNEVGLGPRVKEDAESGFLTAGVMNVDEEGGHENHRLGVSGRGMIGRDFP